MRSPFTLKSGGDVGWMKVVAMAARTKVTALLANMGQSVLSLSFNLGAMLAGALIVLYFDVFSLAPWTLALFPGILSIRGAIGGLFSGRLSTALHIGTVRPSYTRNTRYFYLLLYVTIVLTLESSIVLGLTASLFNLLLWRGPIIGSIDILAVVIATMGLSLILIPPVTIGVSVLTFKRGLDPDVMVYPVISTVADILVTACYILVLNSFFWLTSLGRSLIWLFNFVFLFIVLYILIKNVREKEFVKTIKEFFLTLILVSFIVNLTGVVLNAVSKVIGGRPEIYVVYPALIDTIGDVGSIVGSTATTKLALGLIESSLSSIKLHLTEIGGAWAASIIVFTLYSLISSFTHRTTVTSDLLRLTGQLLITNILAVSSMVLVAFAVAIFTYKRGWDPDNFVIPLESSLADGVTTLSLLVALTAIT